MNKIRCKEIVLLPKLRLFRNLLTKIGKQLYIIELSNQSKKFMTLYQGDSKKRRVGASFLMD